MKRRGPSCITRVRTLLKGVKTMNTEKIINELERTIKKVCSDVKRKKGAVGCDKLDSLSKLINSYSRLLERHQDFKDRKENNKSCYAEILKKSYQ